jgi:phosphatidylserine/phosphatidylglycerophosphate/cardiolipin synthase-like enzyme
MKISSVNASRYEIGLSEDTSSASDHKILVQILRSKPRKKRPPFTTFSRFFGERWKYFPKEGQQEIFYGFTQAIENAKHYIYIEDQYLREQTGGEKEYEIYPSLVRAAKRGVKVILVGSGERDALDMNLFPNGINRTVNSDLQKKVLDKLTPSERNNVVVHRVEHTKVHAKVWAIDDKFAAIGSANMFSRSHTTDQERTAIIATNGPWVRNFRSQLWAEHLRLSEEDSLKLENLEVDDAFGFWRPEWATNKTPKLQRGVIGDEDVLTFVGPGWTNDEES